VRLALEIKSSEKIKKMSKPENITTNECVASICVITFNHEDYIEQCIESLASQTTDFKYEIIIGDDNSNDNTTKILRSLKIKYPEKIKAIFRDKNIGGVKNYTEVHNMASGHYVAHVDGDDFWLPGKLAQQVNFLENHPECSAVYSNAFLVNKFGDKFGKFNKKIPEVFDRNYLLEKGNFLNASSLIYRKFLQKKIIPKNCEFIDYQIHLQCSRYGFLGYINEPLVSYRVNPTGFALKHTNKVTGLYWAAVLEAFEHDGISSTMKSAITDFMGTVFCRAIIERDPLSAKKWIEIIHAKTKISKNYIITFGLFKAGSKIANSAKKRLLRSLNMPVTFASR